MSNKFITPEDFTQPDIEVFLLAHSRGCGLLAKAYSNLSNTTKERLYGVCLLDPVAKNQGTTYGGRFTTESYGNATLEFVKCTTRLCSERVVNIVFRTARMDKNFKERQLSFNCYMEHVLTDREDFFNKKVHPHGNTRNHKFDIAIKFKKMVKNIHIRFSSMSHSGMLKKSSLSNSFNEGDALLNRELLLNKIFPNEPNQQGSLSCPRPNSISSGDNERRASEVNLSNLLQVEGMKNFIIDLFIVMPIANTDTLNDIYKKFRNTAERKSKFTDEIDEIIQLKTTGLNEDISLGAISDLKKDDNSETRLKALYFYFAWHSQALIPDSGPGYEKLNVYSLL